jgi:hypothetical protein
VFKDIEGYLQSQKERAHHDEYLREIILVSQPSLRLGDSPYWLHNLNKHHSANSFLIITDPFLAGNDLLMKPFAQASKVRVFHSPLDQNLAAHQLTRILNKLQPRHLICPHLEHLVTDSQITVVHSIHQGQTVSLPESQIGNFKYMGLCPLNLANLIKQKNKMSRLNGLEVEFKDQKYQINQVFKKQDAKARDKLFFKILEVKAARSEEASHLASQLIKISGP